MSIPLAASRAPVGGTVVAIDIGGTKIDVALADAEGALLARTRLVTCAQEGPEQAFRRIADAVGQLRDMSAADFRLPVLGYAAVCPGVVQADRLLMAPNLPGWERIGLALHLQAVLDVDRVEVSNDVRAGALAELRFGALRDAEPGIYVSLGTGIAAALTVGGKVLSGAHQAAGEIAYVAVSTDLPSAPGVAPLEDAVGGKSLGERASELLGIQVSARELFLRRDEVSRRIVEEALAVFGTALANLAVFTDPQRIAVGGGMMGSAALILPALQRRVRAIVPFATEVVAATFTEDASLYGAIALALDAASFPRTQPIHLAEGWLR